MFGIFSFFNAMIALAIPILTVYVVILIRRMSQSLERIATAQERMVVKTRKSERLKESE